MPNLVPVATSSGQIWTASEANGLYANDIENPIDFSRSTGVIIPMYIYPSSVFANSDYNELIDLKKQYHDVDVIAILNPSNGPGSVTDGNYAAAIQRLKGAGIRTAGYISTGFTSVDITSVYADVDGWLTYYNEIDGIFFDEMTNTNCQTQIDYFTSATAYAHQQGLYPSIGNPGAGTVEGYFSNPTADIILIHENSTTPFISDLKGDFDGGYADFFYNRRGAILYGQNSLSYTSADVNSGEAALDDLRKYLGYVFVTDDGLPNPYDSLSPFLGDLFAYLANPISDQFLTKHDTPQQSLVITENGDVGINRSNPSSILHIEDNNVGGDARIILNNPDESNTASNARLTISVGTTNGSTSGDPMIQLANNGVRSWYMNLDNSDSDKLKIATSISGDYLVIDGDGRVSFGETSPDVDAHGLCLNQGTGTGKIVTYKQSNVAHGMTSIAETDTYGFFFPQGGGSGGLGIVGFGATDTGALLLRAYSTNEQTSKATSSFGGIILDSILKSGTGGTSHGSTGNLFTLRNNSTTRIIVSGDGSTYWTGGTLSTGGEASPDVDAGGICLNHGTSDGNVLTFKNSDVNHNVTDFIESDTYAEFYKYSSTEGGLGFSGVTEGSIGVGIFAIATTEDTTTSTLSNAAYTITSNKNSGTSTTDISASGNLLTIRNNATARVILKGDGSTFWTGGALSTGGEASPDVDPGGICLNQGTGTGNMITLKQSNVAHGMTSVDETDTYFKVYNQGGNFGGTGIHGYSESGTIPMLVRAYLGGGEFTDDTTSSVGTITLDALLKSGTTGGNQGNTGSLFVIRNNSTARFLVKGNGDIHATNTTITALDDYDDIALARNLQLALGGDRYRHQVNQSDFQQLVDLKAISSNGEFQILQGCTAVTLGAISQLFNAMKGLAKKMGLSEQELLDLAKDY